LRKYTLYTTVVIALSLMLISWGNQGHKIISAFAFLSFNEEMSQFNDWKSFLVDHASDPDYRRSNDPYEGPKHYLDIDNYPEFVSEGKIAHDWLSVVSQHNYDFVIDNGTLPWATVATYDSLRTCFERRDWAKAKVFAADLGHYVADGFMPMHITINYDGKMTGNDGIHSLYETSMLGVYASQIVYEGDAPKLVENVSDYVFDYIYRNYPYVDSVLIADDYARSVSSSTTSSEYKAALWEKTEKFTVALFKEASHSVADLFYTAWVKAGRPLISGGFYYTDVPSVSVIGGVKLNHVFPNPASTSAEIRYSLDKATKVKLEIIDTLGQTMITLADFDAQPGEYSCRWGNESLANGSYFVRLKTDELQLVRRMVLTKE